MDSPTHQCLAKLIRDPPKAYRAYRREIADRFSRRDPDANGENGRGDIAEVHMSEAADVPYFIKKRPRDIDNEEARVAELGRMVRHRVA